MKYLQFTPQAYSYHLYPRYRAHWPCSKKRLRKNEENRLVCNLLPIRYELIPATVLYCQHLRNNLNTSSLACRKRRDLIKMSDKEFGSKAEIYVKSTLTANASLKGVDDLSLPKGKSIFSAMWSSYIKVYMPVPFLGSKGGFRDWI